MDNNDLSKEELKPIEEMFKKRDLKDKDKFIYDNVVQVDFQPEVITKKPKNEKISKLLKGVAVGISIVACMIFGAQLAVGGPLIEHKPKEYKTEYADSKSFEESFKKFEEEHPEENLEIKEDFHNHNYNESKGGRI